MFEGIPDPPDPALWLMNVLTGVGAAAALAYAAVPAAQRKLLPPVTETRLRDHILFDRVLDDGTTVRCTDGSLFSLIEVRGVDLSARDAEQQEMLFQSRRRWIDKLAGRNVGLCTLHTRSLHDHAADVSGFHDPVLRQVQEAWHGTFRRSYRNRHYVTLSVKGGAERSREVLREAIGETLERLRGHGAEMLHVGKPGEASPLLTRLAEMLNPGRSVSVMSTDGLGARMRRGRVEAGTLDRRLADHLIATELIFHDGLGKTGLATFRDGPAETWMAAVGIATWGGSSSTDILAAVLAADAELVVAQWVDVMDRATAKLKLEEEMRRSVKGQMERIQGVSVGLVNQYSAALEVLTAKGDEAQSLCRHQMAVFIYGRDREDLEYRVAQVRKAIELYHVLPARETASLEPLWFSQFPPHCEWIRPCRVMSPNVAHFISFETSSQGLSRCDWGQRAVTTFRTNSGSPYDFCWHISDAPLAVGHALIIGGTGRGKTVLQTMLGTSSLGYPSARVFLLDRSDGAYVSTRAFGGTYLHLQTDSADLIGDVCQLNPLQMDIEPGGVGGATGFLINWLRYFVTECLDQESERALGGAVRELAKIPKKERKLSDIYRAIPDNIPAKAALRRWVEGEYRWMFSAAQDSLSFGGTRLFAFDFTRILDDTIAARALLPYLQYRIETECEVNGWPWFLGVDEAAALLADGAFRDWYFKLLQEARKKRGVIASCFQRVQTLRETGTAELLLTQCPTRIIFPTESAQPADYIDTLGLTDEEFRIVRRDHPIANQLERYVLLWREGEGSIVLDVDLSPLGKHLNLFQSGKTPADRLRRLERDHGREEAVRRFLAA